MPHRPVDSEQVTKAGLRRPSPLNIFERAQSGIRAPRGLLAGPCIRLTSRREARTLLEGVAANGVRSTRTMRSPTYPDAFSAAGQSSRHRGTIPPVPRSPVRLGLPCSGLCYTDPIARAKGLLATRVISGRRAVARRTRCLVTPEREQEKLPSDRDRRPPPEPALDSLRLPTQSGNARLAKHHRTCPAFPGWTAARRRRASRRGNRHVFYWPHSGQVGDHGRLIQRDKRVAIVGANVPDETECLIENTNCGS